ncbi:MAG TPA: hypothetical protein VNS63_10255 [Blastocatellia bacterium]|nr:hypothetical protein [Blastocatellia bacterium]
MNGEFAYAPYEWAAKAIEAYRRHRADRIIAEINNGGAMVKATIRTVGRVVSFKSVHASRGKVVRAEPIAAMYEQRNVHHVGACSIRAVSQSYGFRALTGVASNRQANYAATR